MKQFNNSGVVYSWGKIKAGYCQATPRELKKVGTVTNVYAGVDSSFVIKNTKLYEINHIKRPKNLKLNLKLPAIKHVASSDCYFAIDKFGKLWSWGDMNVSLLGRENPRKGEAPQIIETLSEYKVEQVVCGDYHTSCLTTDGEVFLWGHEMMCRNELPEKFDIEKTVQIASADDHMLLLSADRKTVWAWGYNEAGQLGLEKSIVDDVTFDPFKVPFLGEKEIIKIDCGGNCSAVLTVDGVIIMWGSLRLHDEEDDIEFERLRTPRIINIEQKVVDISMGREFMLALTDDNRLYAFGNNVFGQCGQGTFEDNWLDQPVEVKGLQNLRIKQISAAAHHCMIKCAKI